MRETMLRDSLRHRSRCRYRDMELRQLCNGHSPRYQSQHFVHHPPPQRPMMKRVTVHPLLVYQPASIIMEQPGIHRHTRHIRVKGRQPKVSGHSPRGEKLLQIVHSHIMGTTMLFVHMGQTVTQRALPHSAPIHRTPPQLSQFQMNVPHVSVQGGHDIFLVQGATARMTVSKLPLRAVATVRAELLHFHQTFYMVRNIIFGQCRRREVTSPGNRRRDRQDGVAERSSIKMS